MPVSCQTMAVNLVILSVMKVINQVTTNQYDGYNSNEYSAENGTCQLKPQPELRTAAPSPIMFVFHFGYVFALIGSLLAASRLRLRHVLCIGGALMSLALGLMAISHWTGLICHPVFYLLVWLLHPLYMGLVLSCLFYSFVWWSTGPRSRMLLVALYYCCSSEFWMSVTVEPVIKEHLGQRSRAYAATVGFGLSLVFTGLALLLREPENSRQSPFELPNRHRLIRYSMVLSAFTMFAVQLNNKHVQDYQTEILLFSNASTAANQSEPGLLQTMARFNVPELVNQAGFLALIVALTLVGAFREKVLTFRSRILIGLILAAAVAMACFIADLILAKVGPVSLTLASAFFCTASCLDGAAEILVMVAMYELTVAISDRRHTLLVVGIALSIWSLAFFMRLGLRSIVDAILGALKADNSSKHSVHHAVDVAWLLVCLAYVWVVSFPRAFTFHEETLDSDFTEEETALLSNSDQVNRINS